MDGCCAKLFILLTLVLFEVQDTQAQACRFEIPGGGGSPGFPSLTFLEDSTLGELDKYPTIDMTSMTDPDTEEYIDFYFDNGELTLTLVKPLTELIDAGINILQPKLTATCVDGSKPVFTFVITITDVNNKPALFDQSEYPVSLQKPWPSNVPINFGVPIKVTDLDFDPSNADVTFISDNDIVNIIGERVEPFTEPPFVYNVILTLKDSSQFNENTEFQITATNGLLTPEKATVKVTVEDINVHPPVFNQPLHVTATKVTWPPEPSAEVPLSGPITVFDREGSTVQLSIGGDHPDLVAIEQNEDLVSIKFKNIPDSSAFETTNGVAVIQLIARDEGNLESTAIVLIVFDIADPPTTTEACPEATTESCVCPTTEAGTTPAECPTTQEPCVPCSTPAEDPTTTTDAGCPETTTDSCVCPTTEAGTTPDQCPEVTTAEPCIPCSTPPEGTTPAECSEATTVTVMEPCPTPSEGTTPAECPEATTVTVSEPCIPCSTAAEGINTSTALPCEQCDECTCPPATDCPTTCPPPVTCSSDPSDPCECDTTTTEKPDDEDDDCEDASNTGFIIGIVITSVLFVAAAVLAAYLWFLLRKARIFTQLTPAEPWNPPMQQESKLSSGSLTPRPPPVATVVETNVNPVRRPSILKRTSFQDASPTLDSPSNDFEKERELRNSLTQAKNPLVDRSPSPAAAAAAPAPSIPQPDYRTKPDYKVKINDTVEIVPNEVTEYNYSDNERNPNSGASSDIEANEGDERL